MADVGPLQSQVYVNQILSNVSIDWTNADNVLIADKLFPVMPVKFRTGIYYKYDKSKFHVVNDLRAPGTPANIVKYGLTQQTYGPLKDHMLKQEITDEDRDQAVAPLDMDVDTTNNVTERIVLSKEQDAYNQSTSSTNFTVANKTTLSGTAMWDQYGSSDPIGDVRKAKNVVKLAILGKKPNTMVITYEVFTVLEQHPQIIERIKYSERGIITAEILAAVFGIPNILVPDAVQNTANENQTDVIAYLWGKNVWIVYIAQGNIGIRSITYGMTLQKGARQTLQWRDPAPDTFQDWVGVRQYYQQFVFAAEAAYWYANVIN